MGVLDLTDKQNNLLCSWRRPVTLAVDLFAIAIPASERGCVYLPRRVHVATPHRKLLA